MRTKRQDETLGRNAGTKRQLRNKLARPEPGQRQAGATSYIKMIVLLIPLVLEEEWILHAVSKRPLSCHEGMFESRIAFMSGA